MSDPIRDRLPIRKTNSGNSKFQSNLKNMSVNFAEINFVREIVPTYSGGSQNLSYYIQQCDKIIKAYKNNTPGQEQSTYNKLIFELCCSELAGTTRETLIISNCKTWTQVKDALINRFGDQRNETLLENDRITRYQFQNKNYKWYYERVKSRLQQIQEHLGIREENDAIKNFKTEMYKQRAQNTFCASLLEPYRETNHKPLVSLFSLKSPNSRLVKWRLRLEEYNYQVQYKKEKENVVADALSRVEINCRELVDNDDDLDLLSREPTQP
ncbi:hypothetical protein ILUMI_00065 [Ignelater luminosus]|uniref:Uncharacterized protein n=1 Tax=Ignelater luminosus TaxID=2038154 RepID=A0A8K0DI08_IGNLU|nr:hypothetical protein ILUMI_00065 [Ignelater luminosus]